MGPEDQLVINDVQPGTQEITSRIAVGSFVNWITGQDLNFTGDISFLGIKPNPNNPNDFDIEVDNISINKSITLGPNAEINGLYVDDLEDVEIDAGLLKEGQVLMWDDTEQKWYNNLVTIINLEDSVEGLIEDAIDELTDTISSLTDSVESLTDSIESLDSDVNDSIKLLTDSISTLYSEVEFLNTEVTQLKFEMQGKVDPAPADNNLYVMQNGQWVVLPEVIVPEIPETFSLDRDL